MIHTPGHTPGQRLPLGPAGPASCSSATCCSGGSAASLRELACYSDDVRAGSPERATSCALDVKTIVFSHFPPLTAGARGRHSRRLSAPGDRAAEESAEDHRWRRCRTWSAMAVASRFSTGRLLIRPFVPDPDVALRGPRGRRPAGRPRPCRGRLAPGDRVIIWAVNRPGMGTRLPGGRPRRRRLGPARRPPHGRIRAQDRRARRTPRLVSRRSQTEAVGTRSSVCPILYRVAARPRPARGADRRRTDGRPTPSPRSCSRAARPASRRARCSRTATCSRARRR